MQFAKFTTEHERVMQIEKLPVMGQMVSEIVHQLNSPLVGVINLAELAERNADDPERVKALLPDMRKAGDHCRGFVQRMLVINKIARSEPQSTDLNALAQETIGFFHQKMTPGYFEQANGGTLLLNEITDMNPTLQVSLLRVQQERTFTRLGSTLQRPSDFRLICATNKDLQDELKAGRFRSDLYYRINVVALKVPPLRQRREDILPLALLFLDHFNHKFGKRVGPLTQDAVALLEESYWAGNMRKLRNTIERTAAIKAAGPVTPTDLGALSAGPAAAAAEVPVLAFREARDRFERVTSAGCCGSRTATFSRRRGCHASRARTSTTTSRGWGLGLKNNAVRMLLMHERVR